MTTPSCEKFVSAVTVLPVSLVHRRHQVFGGGIEGDLEGGEAGGEGQVAGHEAGGRNLEHVAELAVDLAELGVIMIVLPIWAWMSKVLAASWQHWCPIRMLIALMPTARPMEVIPMVENAARNQPETLLQLHLRTPSGALVPVSSIASLERETAPRSLAKFNQQKSFRIYAGVVPGVTKDQALQTFEQAAKNILPANYSVDYAGESRQLRKEGNSMLSVLFISLCAVYLVLVVQFNSFRSALVVLMGSVPLALSGALLFTYFGFTTINIYAQIGFITLVGLVAKNGILITRVRQRFAKAGFLQSRSHHQCRANSPATGIDDHRGHHSRSLPAGAGDWRRC